MAQQVQLIFAGEVLDGFQAADVRRALGERLKLDEARLDKLFSGGRVIIKRGLTAPVANQWVAQFRAMGAKLHVHDEPLALHPVMAAPPAPAVPVPAPAGPPGLQLVPLAGDPHAAPAPAPIAAHAAAATEMITCPVCGEEQPKRILCRACAADMPRGIANKLADEEAERTRRREEALARRGARPGSAGMRAADRSGAPSRLTPRPYDHAEDDAPLFGLSFEGRIGRMRYFLGGLVFLLALTCVILLGASLPGLLLGSMLLFGLAFGLVWSFRLTVLRLHDIGHSGWWVLVLALPGLGTIASIVLLLWPGSPEDNDHGSPPSQEGAKAAVAVLVTLMVIWSWGAKTAINAFEQQVQELREEAESEELGLEGEDDTGAATVALPPASELRRVLRSDVAVDEFRRYVGGPGHRAFAISDAGAWGWHSGAARPNQAVDTALGECERRRQPYTPECRVVHLNNEWVMQ